MPILRLVPLAAPLLLIAATCVTNVEQRGPAGPWVGDVTNTGDEAVSDATASARVWYSDGTELGPGASRVCPETLLPGQHGAFEMSVTHEFVPPADERSPLRAEFAAIQQANPGFGTTSGDGLHAELQSTLDLGRVANVRIANNSARTYSDVRVCAVRFTTVGTVASVTFTDSDERITPGDSMTLSLFLGNRIDGTLRLYPSGQFEGDTPHCCPHEGPSTWHSVDTGSFSVLLPPGWTYEPNQGIDSFIGDFVGDGVTLHFDYGWYSNSLPYDDDPNYHVHFETVAGRDAKIVYPTSGDGETGIYFPAVTGGPPFAPQMLTRHNIIGQDLTQAQRDIALQIFRSIRFDAP